MILGSARNWIAVNAVQQSSLNKKMKTKNMTTPVSLGYPLPVPH
jgi:hypothetical protein